MRRTLKWAAVGAAIGLVAVTVFATGEMLGSPGHPETAVVIILALAMGGLMTGVPIGAGLGAIAALLTRSRAARREPPRSSPQPAPGAAAMAPAPVRPSPEAQRDLLALRERAAREAPAAIQRARQAAQPAPLAPLSAPPPSQQVPVVDTSDPERLNRVLAELDGMPGMEQVAGQVRRMARRVLLDQQRLAQGLKTAETSYHAVFVGPPGTGKTTVARVWGKALAAMGALPSGHVIETDRSGLVGQHVGSTANLTAEKFAEARGGVLFIDEAYMLTPPGPLSNDFGREAVDSLLTRMTSERATTAVVAAGYDAEMERFLDSNPGLRRRFTHTLTFENYNGPTLLRIAQAMAKKADYLWAPEAEGLLGQGLARLAAAPPKGWGNAGSVESILNAAIDSQAERLAGEGGEPADLATLTAEDVRAALLRLFPQAL